MENLVFDLLYLFHPDNLTEIKIFDQILKSIHNYTTFYGSHDMQLEKIDYKIFICFVSKVFSQSKDCVNKCKWGLEQNKSKLIVLLEKRNKNELDNSLGNLIAPYLRIHVYKDRNIFDMYGQQFNLLLSQIENFLNPCQIQAKNSLQQNLIDPNIQTIIFHQGTYKGQVNKNGDPHGKGSIYWLNGDISIGKFKNGKLNGKGKYTWKNGSIYQGEFKDNEINGIGKYFNGDLYIGYFKEGKKEGKGKYYWNLEKNSNGDWYEGEYKEDKKNGYGKMYWKDGKYFEGQWKNDLKHGPGVFYEANGKTRKQFYSYDQLIRDNT
jgi:hypothetical protein